MLLAKHRFSSSMALFLGDTAVAVNETSVFLGEATVAVNAAPVVRVAWRGFTTKCANGGGYDDFGGQGLPAVAPVSNRAEMDNPRSLP